MVNASLTLPVSSTSWLRTSGANFVEDIAGGIKAVLILMFGLRECFVGISFKSNPSQRQ